MKLTSESKLFLGIIAVTIVIIGLASIVMTKPAPAFTKEDLIPAGTYTKGNPQAKVTLVEFSDFQCPACLAAKPTVDAILKAHPNDLLFAYRNFPLNQHPFSHQSAQAAESAGIQGKYWDMYDLLFANQEKFADSLFPELAKSLDLDLTKFDSDMKNETLKTKILNDISAGTRFGVNSTPSFFLNGKKLNLASFDDLTKAVEEAIKNSN